MSMTKRHLESLPKEQQDDILGLPPTMDGEWYESAENEPEELPGDNDDLECAPADKFEQRNNAPLVKPRGHCVRYDGWDV